MLAGSKVYTGPAVSPWRRLVLRYARTAAVLLMLVWLATLFASLLRLGNLPPAISHVPLMLLVLGVAAAVWAHFERQRLVRESPLPQFLKRKLRETYPHLSGKDVELVERGLRQFFWLVCAARASLWPCRRAWSTACGMNLFCTPGLTGTGASCCWAVLLTMCRLKF